MRDGPVTDNRAIPVFDRPLMSDVPPASLPDAPLLCGICGVEIAAGLLASQCPRCLLSLATDSGGADDGFMDDDLLDPLQLRRFGDYELVQEIARGGMGVVYRARQISLDREVAVKMILAGELAGRQALRMFQTEAQAAANLHHPHIVPVYEIGEHELQHYFSMRYVPGGETIAHWARRQRGHHEVIAAAVAQVARAVAHAHERGVLHRDLKPSNILWDPDSGPQVTDFGLAKLMDAADVRATHTQHLVGSPSYMAPEQMGSSTVQITTATDVYGIGALLYELLSGRPPFIGATVIETARLVNEEAPAPLTKVHLDLCTVCLKCLAKRPEDRYSSATALAEDLESFSQGKPVTAVPLTPAQRLLRWARRKPAVAALLALCLLSFIFGISGIVWQWRRSETALAGQAKALAHLEWQQVDHWLKDGETSQALAYLASLLRAQPGNTQAATYAMSIVDQHAFPILAGPPVHPPAPLAVPVGLAPNGQWFAGAGTDHVVRIWSCVSGQEMLHLRQEAPVVALAVADGPWSLALALDSNQLLTYTSLTSPPKVLPRVLKGAVHRLLFSDDGSLLLAASAEGVEAWQAARPEDPPRLLSLPGEGKVLGMQPSRDGRHVLLWGTKQAFVWDPAGGQKLLSLTAQERFGKGCISANGRCISLVDGGFNIRSWEVSQATEFKTISSSLEFPTHVALDAEGKHVTTGTGSSLLYIYDVESGLRLPPVMAHHYAIREMLSSGDGQCVLTYGADDMLMLWDAATGASLRTAVHMGHARLASAAATSRHGDTVLIQSPAEAREPETVAIWKATHARSPQIHHVEGTRDFDISRMSPDGRLGCLALLPRPRCVVYEFATGKVLLDKPVQGGVYVNQLSPDGKRYYLATATGWIYGWSLETGEELWKPLHVPGRVRPGVLTPDGSRLILGYDDGHIRILDTATGELLLTLDHPGEVKGLSLAPDGSHRFLSGSTDGLAQLWEFDTGKRLQTFAGHESTIISTAWHPDAKHIATGSYDGSARLWDVETGRQIGISMRHGGWVSHVEFSPDGTQLATACRDGNARLWSSLTGKPLGQPMRQGYCVDTLRFTHDGSLLFVRDLSGFRYWDTHTSEPVTIHFQEPESSGVGMDSEASTAYLSPDDTHVFLGSAMNYGALWTVELPHTPVPPWFSDFLDSLGGGGEVGIAPAERLLTLRLQIGKASATDPHARWALGVLGLGGK